MKPVWGFYPAKFAFSFNKLRVLRLRKVGRLLAGFKVFFFFLLWVTHSKNNLTKTIIIILIYNSPKSTL